METNRDHGRSHLPGFIACLLVLCVGCGESTPAGPETDQTIVPGGNRAKRGVGVPALVPRDVTEVAASITVIPISDTPRDITSAPDGLAVRVVGEFLPQAPPSCTGPIPTAGVWTPSTGWAALPVPARRAINLAIRIGDGGHVAGTRGGNCDTGPVGSYTLYWSPAADTVVLVGDSDPADVNVRGDVVATWTSQIAVWSPDTGGGLAFRNVHAELLAGLGLGQSRAAGINDRGQIIGQAVKSGAGGEEAVLIDGDVVQDLGTGLPFERVSLNSINNADPVQITGTGIRRVGSNEFPVALRWTIVDEDSILVEELKGPPGYTSWARAYQIGEHGEVVGLAWKGDPTLDNPDVLLWTGAGDPEGVVVIEDCANPQFHAVRLDSHASLAGLTRVLACNKLYEIDLQ